MRESQERSEAEVVDVFLKAREFRAVLDPLHQERAETLLVLAKESDYELKKRVLVLNSGQ